MHGVVPSNALIGSKLAEITAANLRQTLMRNIVLSPQETQCGAKRRALYASRLLRSTVKNYVLCSKLTNQQRQLFATHKLLSIQVDTLPLLSGPIMSHAADAWRGGITDPGPICP